MAKSKVIGAEKCTLPTDCRKVSSYRTIMQFTISQSLYAVLSGFLFNFSPGPWMVTSPFPTPFKVRCGFWSMKGNLFWSLKYERKSHVSTSKQNVKVFKTYTINCQYTISNCQFPHLYGPLKIKRCQEEAFIHLGLWVILMIQGFLLAQTEQVDWPRNTFLLY